MNLKKYPPLLIFIILLFAVTAHAKLGTSAQNDSPNQTVPTRTSTPGPATATPQSGGDGNTPTATNTPPAEASPTSTLLPVQFAPTPVGGFIATAVPCSGNPTIQTLGATNVRSGPGTEYDIVGELVYLEVRFIAGRAESAEWWLIQYNNGQLGWVADEIVLVQGYTAVVPIVEAPELAGGTPTPGAAWQPTPAPFCTVTPIATAVSLPTLVVEPVEEAPTQTAIPTDPPPPATEVRPTATAIVQPTAVPPVPTATLINTASGSDDESGNNLGSILLAVGVLGAIILAIVYRRQR